MEFIILLTLFLYVFQIIRYAIGWTKISRISQKKFSPKISIIIALRNEESKIDGLLKSLQSQIYPIDNLEFILVNDHSTDNSLSLLEKFTLDNMQIINMPEGKFGKKHAINMAVSIASGEIILASDADCIFSASWARSMVSYFSNVNVKLVSAPVFFRRQDGIFQIFQSLEFASLIGSGAGAIGIKNSIFCNGANMAYRKETFLELNSFKSDSAVSGDDVFLLHNIKAKYPNSIVFAKDQDAIVMTDSTQNFTDFLNQRKRWSAKSSSYKDRYTIYVSCLVFFTNLSFIFLFVAFFFDGFLFKFFALFYLIKFIVDLLLLLPVLKFFKRKDLIKWIFPFEILYSFYIILIVILSLTNKFEWKGRMHKK